MADATYIPSVTNAPSSLPPSSQWLGQLCFAVTGSGEKVLLLLLLLLCFTTQVVEARGEERQKRSEVHI